jgi:ERCC4-type nuclease
VLKLVVDSREQAPYPFANYNCEVLVGTLTTGDYSLVGLDDRVAVERKELSDLLGCLAGGRERFCRELARGKSMDSLSVVVEATWADLASGNYRSKMDPHAACQSVITLQQRYRVPFVFCGSRAAAEYWTYWTLQKYLHDVEKRLKTIEKAHYNAA